MKRTNEQIQYQELLVPFDVAHRKGDALWPATVHIHDQPEIFYHISGAQSFLINGAAYELNAGDLLVVRPLLPHCVQPVSYTHLDVYKRQPLLLPPKISTALPSKVLMSQPSITFPVPPFTIIAFFLPAVTSISRKVT